MNEQTRLKLNSLSKRLLNLTQVPKQHYNTNIALLNSRLGIVNFLSKVLPALRYADKSIRYFKKVIDNYNESESTDLKFLDFRRDGWVRIILDEVKVPSAVKRQIFRLPDENQNNNESQLSPHEIHLLQCLKKFYFETSNGNYPRITLSQLELVLKDFVSNEINLKFLLKNEIFEKDRERNNEFIYNNHNPFQKEFSNELFGLLWNDIANESSKFDDFIKVIKIITNAHVWISDLSPNMTTKQLQKLNEIAVKVLENERDLNSGEKEIQKVWLDSHHVSLKSKTPNIQLQFSNTWNLVNAMEFTEAYLHDIFQQDTRGAYSYLLQLVILSDDQQFSSTIQLIKDSSRPYLVFDLLFRVPRQNPEIIPYLLIDLEVAFLTFNFIEEIEINETYVSHFQGHQNAQKAKSKIYYELYIEMFKLTLEQFFDVKRDLKKHGTFVAQILMTLSEKVFQRPTNEVGTIKHIHYNKLYAEILSLLDSKEDVFVKYLPEVISEIIKNHDSDRKFSTSTLRLKSAEIDLNVEIVRYMNRRNANNELFGTHQLFTQNATKELVQLAFDDLEEYYQTEKIKVNVFGEQEERLATRSAEFGLEIMDWGYLYLNFFQQNLFSHYLNIVEASLEFNHAESKYAKENRENILKIRFLLSTLLIAFNGISNKSDEYENDHFPVQEALAKLQTLILNSSLEYSKISLRDGTVSVFGETFSSSFSTNIYYQPPIKILYQCLNNLEKERRVIVFLTDFFKDSIEIGMMLSAINSLESSNAIKSILQRIDHVDIKEFIESKSTLAELQNTLIEAVNSTKHELAQPILDKFQSHLERVKGIHATEFAPILFEIKLLLSYKRKELDSIESQPIPNIYHQDKLLLKELRDFYISLYQLRDNDYSAAIRSLKNLVKFQPRNVRYRYHLFSAQTLKAKNYSEDQLLVSAKEDWDKFLTTTSEDQKQELMFFSELIDKNTLYYHCHRGNDVLIYQITQKLHKKNLFDREIIETLFQYYHTIEKVAKALKYLQDAENYYIKNGLPVPEIIPSLQTKYPNVHDLEKLRTTLDILNNLQPNDIPRVLPKRLNGEIRLEYFVLKELVQACQIMLRKIEGVRNVKHENRYNDLLFAILRLRLPVWGWQIEDQPRMGTSPKRIEKNGESKGGKDAGEVDLAIQHNGLNIAICEAFILKNLSNTSEHILKLPKYDSQNNCYFALIYVLGSQTNFGKKIQDYKKYVHEITYPTNFELTELNSFEDISNSTGIRDNQNLIATVSNHSDGKKIYHLIININ